MDNGDKGFGDLAVLRFAVLTYGVESADINTYLDVRHPLYAPPMFSRRHIPAVLLVYLLALVGQSVSVPIMEPFSIHKLLDSADLVVVGQVSEVQELGTTSVEYRGSKYPGHSFLARVETDEVIKGDSPRILNVRLEQASIPGQGLTVPQVSRDMRRMFFLAKDNDGWKPVSSGYSILPAGTKPCSVSNGTPNSVETRVLVSLISVLCSPVSASTVQVMMILRYIDDPMLIDALKRLAQNQDTDADTEVAAVSDLIRRKQTWVLPQAEWAILQDTRPTPSFPRSNLLAALAFDGSPEAMVIVEKALKMEDARMRISAAQSLGQIQNQRAIDMLISTLADPNQAVQVAVMDSLGNITRQYDWQVLAEKHTFPECLQHWHDFAVKRRNRD